jgi:hypothetical protein
MNNKIQILDPLSCLCKLGMLAYYPIGTKISILNNIIVFQQPDTLQWIKRTYYGDSKNDISVLYNPILKAIKWYILCNNERLQSVDGDVNINFEENVEEKYKSDNIFKLRSIKNIFTHAIKGLTKLIDTYEYGNVTLSIKFIKNNIKMCIDDNYNIEQFINFNEIDEIDDNVINYEKIRQIWRNDKINLISRQFDLLDKSENDTTGIEYLIKSINLQLMEIDMKFQDLVKTMNSNL